MKKVAILLLGSCLGNTALAGGKADPMLGSVIINELERRSDRRESAIDMEAWLGHDIDKLWVKLERSAEAGSTEEAALQLLYSRAVAPFWDLQTGLRRQFNDSDTFDALVLGVQGLAPFNIETDAALFVDDDGIVTAEIELGYELRFTQQWILEPEITLLAHSETDRERALGSGLAEVETALRLFYYPQREWAPYVGLAWHRTLGDQRDFAETAQSEQWVIGLRGWF